MIEQAKGIIMSTMGCDEDSAFQVLKSQSQSQNVKLRELAAEIVHNVSRRRPPGHHTVRHMPNERGHTRQLVRRRRRVRGVGNMVQIDATELEGESPMSMTRVNALPRGVQVGM